MVYVDTRWWQWLFARSRSIVGHKVSRRDVLLEPGSLVSAGAKFHATDLVKGRRPGTAGLRDLVRLTQHFDVLQMMPPLVEPQDVPTQLRHYFTMETQLTESDKFPFIFSRGTPQVSESFEMLRDFRGLSDAEFHDNVYCYTIINTNSPRQLDIPMAQGLIDFARAGQVSIITPFTLMGAMAPIAVPDCTDVIACGSPRSDNVDTARSPRRTHHVRDVHPNVDMRSGAPAFGTPEHFKASLAAGQLARHDLPWRCASGSLRIWGRPAANETQFDCGAACSPERLLSSTRPVG